MGSIMEDDDDDDDENDGGLGSSLIRNGDASRRLLP